MIEAIDETIGEGSVGAMSNRTATGWITSDNVRRVDAAVETAVLEFDISSPPQPRWAARNTDGKIRCDLGR